MTGEVARKVLELSRAVVGCCAIGWRLRGALWHGCRPDAPWAARECPRSTRSGCRICLRWQAPSQGASVRRQHGRPRAPPPRHPPRRRGGFSVITFVPRYLHAGNLVGAFRPTTRSRPRLGLVVRSRVATHPGVRGLCHWAGELTGRQATEPPSRRAAEPTSARTPIPPRPH